mmetsp:Transcript_32136/g.47273  ORF Transcript_32136/g.47273 Transcript_32136/m.47273 type:complete len:357 (+) Transcript_32136:40-1110(+)
MCKAIIRNGRMPSRRSHRQSGQGSQNTKNSVSTASTNCEHSSERRRNCPSLTHHSRASTPTKDSRFFENNVRRNIPVRTHVHISRVLQKIQWESIGPFIALDCEMVGIGPNGSQSALARVSIVNWAGTVILDTFVKVAVPVTDYRTFVSGVTAKDIEAEDAMDLGVCRYLVQAILKQRVLIGHALVNDLCALNINHPWYCIRDTAKYPPYMQLRRAHGSEHGHQMKARKLRDLAWDKLGICIQQMGKAHSSIEDARATLDLYKLARNEWETLVSWQIEKSSEAARVNTPRCSFHIPALTPSPRATPACLKQVTSSLRNRTSQNRTMPIRMHQNFMQYVTVHSQRPTTIAAVAHTEW